MKKTIFLILFLLIIFTIIGLYIYDVVINDVAPEKNLFRTLAIVCLSIASIIRLYSTKGRRSLDFYEKYYKEEIQNAFTNEPFWRKKLISATRLYDERKYNKALKYLWDLLSRCKTSYDTYAVLLFAGLCFTDLRLYEESEKIYLRIILNGQTTSTVYSNLGYSQMNMGKYEEAIRNYKHALEYDESNEYACNNLAQTYFKSYDFENAIQYALKALEINPKFNQASSLLAIIYALEHDQQNYEKYYHIAVSTGYNPEDIKRAIKYFKTMREDVREDLEIGEDE